MFLTPSLSFGQLVPEDKVDIYSIALVEAARATVVGSRVKVVVSQGWIGRTKSRWNIFAKRSLSIGISAWGSVYFRIDDETREFQFDELELGGI